MSYTIKANTKSYSEWSVDQATGKLDWCEHQFDGCDIVSYKIVDSDDEEVFEHEEFSIVKAKLEQLEQLIVE